MRLSVVEDSHAVGLAEIHQAISSGQVELAIGCAIDPRHLSRNSLDSKDGQIGYTDEVDIANRLATSREPTLPHGEAGKAEEHQRQCYRYAT